MTSKVFKGYSSKPHGLKADRSKGQGSDYLYTLPFVQYASVKYKSKVSEPCHQRKMLS